MNNNELAQVSQQASELFQKLFPINRSISGDGVRQTFSILNQIIELDIHSVSSGETILDWQVPPEWNVNDAFIADSKGKKVIDFQESNLHLVSYSIPLDKKAVPFSSLEPHLYYLENLPKAIPYRTRYFNPGWGFCLSYEDFQKLDQNESYDIFIDSSLNDKGKLNFATAYKKGSSEKEIIISTYCCHPSLANDNLSGLIMSILFFKYISQQETYYSYRLVIAPETIGAIAFLSTHQDHLKKIIGGTVVTTVAGPDKLGFKRSFLGDTIFDQAAEKSLGKVESDFLTYPFEPDGSDERQFSSPGVKIPTISITKSKYYEYKEYHTSLDDLDFISIENFLKTYQVYLDWFNEIEQKRVFLRKMSLGEYQLGKRGLYPSIGGSLHNKLIDNDSVNSNNVSTEQIVKTMEWLMHLSDGLHTKERIASKAGVSESFLDEIINTFIKHGLIY